MSIARRLVFCVIPAILLVLPAAAQKWDPIPPEELALKEHPTTPGASALILFREMFTDDDQNLETHHYRIKVLTEEGKKQGDVEIHYRKGLTRVSSIEARTIRPDGTAVEFEGRIFDKLVAKYKKRSLQAKTFTMPEVQVGSIIEFRYKLTWDAMIILPTTWVIQSDLFLRKGIFSIKPYSAAGDSRRLMWITSMLPRGYEVKEDPKSRQVKLAVENIAAFEEENWMPPEDMLKTRVEFFYTRTAKLEAPPEFWKREGKEWHEFIEPFLGKRQGVLNAVGALVSPADSPDTKLRKIYARVQQIRNLSYEQSRTEKEEKREKLKENNNVEDVLKRGYGYSWELNRLFVALARTAGLDAAVVRVGSRDELFFNQNLIDARQLNAEVATVRIDGQDRYFDPGTRYCPYGLLSWERTGVRGIRLDKDGGTFIDTVLPDSSNSTVRRKAELELEQDGSIRGKVVASFTGLEALRRRLDNAENDETGKRKELEDEIKEWLPSNTQVKLGSITGWDSVNEPLVVEVEIEIPGFAAATGRRLLLPMALFQANEKHPFQHASRKYAVYFPYPFQEHDEVALRLPDAFRVAGVPQPTTSKQAFGGYERSASFDPQSRTLSWQRHMSIDGILFRTEYYPLLRNFFNIVRQGDEQSLVLQAGDASATR
jgi:hypothetical protein